MNLAKSYEFLKPDMVPDRIHIIGCGAVGSTLAENLVRFGLTKITLYDFDKVESKNIANQIYTAEDIGSLKTEALARYLARINPEITQDLRCVNDGWKPSTKLTGHVFLCVDSIDTRRKITEIAFANPMVKTIWDFRIGLETAQHYATDKSPELMRRFRGTMDFTSAQARESTPVSACNEILSVCPTIRTIVAAGVINFVNLMKGGRMFGSVEIDAFNFQMLAI